MLAGAEYLEGNGDPGSLRLFRLVPALKDLVKESKEKIEKVELGWLVTYEVVGGELRDLYDPYRVTFTFSSVPEKKEEQCTVAWKAEFEPRSPAVPPPLKAKNAALSFLKSFESTAMPPPSIVALDGPQDQLKVQASPRSSQSIL
ncbi:hypothetical protein IEQ34_007454 [Dendrobium chrysotoxum]|uniref:Bet v I/Major latex protein domain-containing protein n=1 Tax=Dendrobium chrysotoxum TaxID=161865 RepID=A0AAV7H4R6_DENCH|nr:hypothetical protein IEQ34_007454 [Dendrobium chrysotoxum]